MNTNSQNQLIPSIISGIIIICYLSIGFVPNLDAVDKIAPQWLIMTTINGLSILFILFNRVYYSISISSTLKSSMSITYICFIIWAFLSYFYAINPTEVVVNITRQVNVLLMYLFMGIFLYSFKQKIKFISWAIVIILAIEVYAVIIEAQNMINSYGYVVPGDLKGVTANRNITAFSLAIKIPFALFLLHILKKNLFKIVVVTLIFLTFLSLSMIQSRASFVGIGVIFLGYNKVLQCFWWSLPGAAPWVRGGSRRRSSGAWPARPCTCKRWAAAGGAPRHPCHAVGILVASARFRDVRGKAVQEARLVGRVGGPERLAARVAGRRGGL